MLIKLENSYLKNIFKKYFQKCSFSTSLIHPEMLIRRRWLYKHGNHIPLVLKWFSKPIRIHQFKAFLLNPNQWKCSVLRSLLCLESLEKGLTQNQTMHNLAEGKFPRQLCKHRDSPGPWLTSVAAFSKRGKGRGEKGEEKGRRVLEAHTHTVQCALAWLSCSCKTPEVLSFWALSSTFTQKPPMQAEGPSSLSTVHVAREVSCTSVRKDIILESDRALAKQTGILQEYWLKYSGWFLHNTTQANPPCLQIQNTGHDVKQVFPQREKIINHFLEEQRKRGMRMESKLQHYLRHRTEGQKITKHL